MNNPVVGKLRSSEAGSGPAVVYFRAGGTASRAAALLARDFRVLTIDPADAAAGLRGFGAEKYCLVAHAHAAGPAFAHALAYPQAVEAIALLAPPPLDASAQLSEVKVPVMVFLGTRDSISPPAIGAAFRKVLPNGHLTFVYDATAEMDNERPEAVAAALKQFLTERERFLVSKDSSVLYP